MNYSEEDIKKEVIGTFTKEQLEKIVEFDSLDLVPIAGTALMNLEQKGIKEFKDVDLSIVTKDGKEQLGLGINFGDNGMTLAQLMENNKGM